MHTSTGWFELHHCFDGQLVVCFGFCPCFTYKQQTQRQMKHECCCINLVRNSLAAVDCKCILVSLLCAVKVAKLCVCNSSKDQPVKVVVIVLEQLLAHATRPSERTHKHTFRPFSYTYTHIHSHVYTHTHTHWQLARPCRILVPGWQLWQPLAASCSSFIPFVSVPQPKL